MLNMHIFSSHITMYMLRTARLAFHSYNNVSEEPVNTLNESFFSGMFVVNKTFFSYLWLLFLLITRKVSRFYEKISRYYDFFSRNYDFPSRNYEKYFSLLRL